MIAVLETFGSAGKQAKGNRRTATAFNPKFQTPNPKPDPPDMASCLQARRNGNEDSAREPIDHLYPLVLKIVRAYLPRRMSEQHLVQTVYMKVFTRLAQLLGQVPIGHWVSRVAVNTCFNAL